MLRKFVLGSLLCAAPASASTVEFRHYVLADLAGDVLKVQEVSPEPILKATSSGNAVLQTSDNQVKNATTGNLTYGLGLWALLTNSPQGPATVDARAIITDVTPADFKEKPSDPPGFTVRIGGGSLELRQELPNEELSAEVILEILVNGRTQLERGLRVEGSKDAKTPTVFEKLGDGSGLLAFDRTILNEVTSNRIIQIDSAAYAADLQGFADDEELTIEVVLRSNLNIVGPNSVFAALNDPSSVGGVEFTLRAASPPQTPAAVPLPGAGLLLAGGIAALGATARSLRRREFRT